MFLVRAILVCLILLPMHARAINWAFATQRLVSMQINGNSGPIYVGEGGSIADVESLGFPRTSASATFGDGVLADVPQQFTGRRPVGGSSFPPVGENDFTIGAGRDA